MSLPPEVGVAYEHGRLRHAAVSVLSVLHLPVLGIGLARGAVGAIVTSLVLVIGFRALRWRGQSWSQRGVVGVLAGTLAAAAQFCIAVNGSGCIGSLCAAWRLPVCSGAGLVAGGIVGARARDLRVLVSGAAIATAAAALGCGPMGMVMVGSAGAAIGAGVLGGHLGRIALRRARPE